MIYTPSFPSGFVLFCDDVREEVGGKITFVGSYANEMVIHGSFPAAVPLGALIVYRDDPASLPKRVCIRTTLDGSDETTLSNVEFDLPRSDNLFPDGEGDASDEVKMAEVRALMKTIVTFTEPAKVRVRAHVGDDVVRLGTLSVRLASPKAEEDPT